MCWHSNISDQFPRYGAAKSFDIYASPSMPRRPPLKNDANMFEIMEKKYAKSIEPRNQFELFFSLPENPGVVKPRVSLGTVKMSLVSDILEVATSNLDSPNKPLFQHFCLLSWCYKKVAGIRCVRALR